MAVSPFTTAPALAQDGTDATGVTAPAGASGIRGWLSGIYSRLGGTLATSLASPLPAGSNTIGSVTVSGQGAAGSPPSGPPVAISGVDGNGNKQHVLTDAAGRPQVAAANGVSLTPTTVTLAAGTSTQVIGANASRKSLAVFLVSSGVTAYLTPTVTATASNGLPLGTGSNFGYAYIWEGSGVPTTPISMLCSAAATVLVWEGQ